MVGASGGGRGGGCGCNLLHPLPGNSGRKRFSALWQGGAGGHRRTQESSREGGRRKAATARRSLAGRTLLVRAMQSLSQTPTRPSAAAGRSNSAAGRRGHSGYAGNAGSSGPTGRSHPATCGGTRPSRLLLVHELQNLSQTPTGGLRHPPPVAGDNPASPAATQPAGVIPPLPAGFSADDYYWCANCKTYHKRQPTAADPAGETAPAPAPAPVTPATPGHAPSPVPLRLRLLLNLLFL